MSLAAKKTLNVKLS